MPIRPRALVAAVVALSAHFAPALAQSETDDPVVATVDGTAIHRSEVEAAAQQLPEQYHQMPLEAIFPQLLEQVINMQLISGAAEAQDLEDDAEVQAALELARTEVLRNAYLTREVGTRVDILLGTDILKDYYVTLNLPANLVHFSQRPFSRDGIRVPFTSLMGTPICTAVVNGLEQKMIVDTGARLTYVDKALTAGLEPTCTEQDFYPTIGTFETPVYELPVTIGGQLLTMHCGVLPPALEQGIRLTGASGIIGTQLYENFIVTLAYPDSEIVLLPNK